MLCQRLVVAESARPPSFHIVAAQIEYALTLNVNNGRFAVVMLADTPSAQGYGRVHHGCLK